ncbi:MlaD family protein [Sunxiuqinia elliptica]|uniref:MlaD protein n=1 Tax=Sunxiuqinia elliptica TaxID=655355 RepID=A0A1I2KTQ6_9BACT|nr:MCE family protein [Sunxiuqinia elliptica]SFF69728.1 MlaD protein [Sunxiuqinia elliptica]
MNNLKILLALLVLGIYSCSPKQTITIEFEELNGLLVDADVLYKGVEIGNVDKVEIAPNGKLLVDIGISKEITLPEKIEFVLFSQNIFGLKAIGINENPDIEPIVLTEIQQGIIQDSSIVNTFMTIGKDLLEITEGDLIKKDSLLKELKKIEERIEKLEKNK